MNITPAGCLYGRLCFISFVFFLSLYGYVACDVVNDSVRCNRCWKTLRRYRNGFSREDRDTHACMLCPTEVVRGALLLSVLGVNKVMITRCNMALVYV